MCHETMNLRTSCTIVGKLNESSTILPFYRTSAFYIGHDCLLLFLVLDLPFTILLSLQRMTGEQLVLTDKGPSPPPPPPLLSSTFIPFSTHHGGK